VRTFQVGPSQVGPFQVGDLSVRFKCETSSSEGIIRRGDSSPAVWTEEIPM